MVNHNPAISYVVGMSIGASQRSIVDLRGALRASTDRKCHIIIFMLIKCHFNGFTVSVNNARDRALLYSSVPSERVQSNGARLVRSG